MADIASPAEVRAARAFLRKRGLSSHQISPRKFANAAKEKGKSFSELLMFLGRIMDADKPESRSRQENIRAAARGDKS